MREHAERGNDWPVSVKAVCLDADGRVLICRNPRGEWELPGGRPEPGESHAATLAREVREETGLDVTVGRLVADYPFEVVPGRWVRIVAYGCELSARSSYVAPVVSAEHTEVSFRGATARRSRRGWDVLMRG